MLLILPVSSFAGWKVQQSYFNMIPYLGTMHFIDNNTGFIGGILGAILQTSDGGDSWTRINIPSDVVVTDLQFLDQNMGYITGNKTYRTDDGGNSWKLVRNDGNTVVYKTLFFANSSLGWIWGENGNQKTFDGGKTWDSYFPNFRSIYALNDQTGWMLLSGDLYKYENSGMYYSKICENLHAGGMFFVNSSTGWLTGQYEIYKTTDGGYSWDVYSTTNSMIYNYLQKPYFINQSTGFALISVENFSAIVKTTDSGMFWQYLYVSTAPDNLMLDYKMNDSGIGYTLGQRFYDSLTMPVLKKTTDYGLTWVEKDLGGKAFPFDSWFLNKSTGFVVGWYDPLIEKSYIQKTVNGGKIWQNVLIPDTTNILLSIGFADKENGMATGSGADLFYTSDGGISWNRNQSNNLTFQEIFPVISQYYIAVGEEICKLSVDGTILKNHNFGCFFHDVYFINDSIGFAVGNSGNIYKTNDSGTSWVKLESGYTNDYYSVFFLTESKGWVGSEGFVLYTDNGGISWTKYTSSDFGQVQDLFFINEYVGWVTTENKVLRSVNGGKSWCKRIGDFERSYFKTSINFVDNKTGWICCGGAVLNTTDGDGYMFAKVDGYVKDCYGTPINKASVIFVNNSTKAVCITDILGYYNVDDFPVGTYALQATATGYESDPPKDISVQSYFVNQNITLYPTAFNKVVYSTGVVDDTIVVMSKSCEIKITFPVNSFSVDTTVNVSTFNPPISYLQPSIKALNVGFDIQTSNNLQPQKEVTLDIKYSDSDVQQLDESNVAIGSYDETNSTWKVLPSTVYVNENKVVAQTTHLSKFALLVQKAASHLGSVLAYPNPCKYNQGDSKIYFLNLTNNIDITLYNISGEVVDVIIENDNDGKAEWDLTNHSHEKVASGIYFYVVSNQQNQKIAGKIAVIK
ncbi:MAG: YCF48-related protein [Elusimicrobiota bacterium]